MHNKHKYQLTNGAVYCMNYMEHLKAMSRKNVAQYMDRWRVLVYLVMNLRVG